MRASKRVPYCTLVVASVATLALAGFAGVAAAAPVEHEAHGYAAETPLGDRLRAAGERETAAWAKLKSKEDWEKYRDVRIAALKRSLGTFPEGTVRVSPGAFSTNEEIDELARALAEIVG